MYIWIDESYDSKFPGHIVIAALILHSENKDAISQCYTALLKRIKDYNHTCKRGKTISCPEIHENVLYRKNKQYRQVKYWAFNILNECSISTALEIKSVYIAIPLNEKGVMTKDMYFSMVSDLVSHCISLCALDLEPAYIIMDNIFDKKQMTTLLQKFKDAFPSSIYQFSFADSAVEKGLQFADLITGTVRRYLNGDKNDARAYEQLQDHFSLVLLETK